MTSKPPTAAKPRPEFFGPYDPDNNGRDVYGHPVNGFGRCEQINLDPFATPPTCPNRSQRIAYLQTQPPEEVSAVAVSRGVPIPPGLAGQALVDALAPAIATAEGLL